MKRDLVLEGHGVRLEPVSNHHLEDVARCGNDQQLWEFTFRSNPFQSTAGAQAWLDTAVRSPNTLTFVIIDTLTGQVAGSTRYHDISEEHRKLEIGWTFLAKRFWRTHVNTAAKYLLCHYAFESWNAVRVQLKAEARNARSNRAILRLGAIHEGTLRNFRIRPDGELSDTAFYSITSKDWPAVKQHLLALLRRPH